MSNYQMCMAVAVRLREGTRTLPSARWKPPVDRAWWAMLERALRHPYDAQAEDLRRARRRELPRFLFPGTRGIRTSEDFTGAGACLRDDYTIARFFRSGWFWQGLWEAGNRGRVVAEFEPEGSFGHDGEEQLYRKPNGDAGSYVVHIELAAAGVRRRLWLDEPKIYREARKATEGRDDIREDPEAYVPRMYRRYNLIDVPDEGFAEDGGGFGYPMPSDTRFDQGHSTAEALRQLRDGNLMVLRPKTSGRRERPRVVYVEVNHDVWVGTTIGRKMRARLARRIPVRDLVHGTWTVARCQDDP
jgi:hypothetical protein